MRLNRPVVFALGLFAALLWTLGRTARAERVGLAYRGPIEVLTQHGGDDDEDETPGLPGGGEGGGEGGGGEGGEGGGGEGGEGGGGEGGEGGGGEGGGEGGDGGTPGVGPTGRGKVAAFDGRRLWNWWWEHNKDRFLARATISGRVNTGSAYYWFGGGAKYPPRDIVPVSEQIRNTTIYPALVRALGDADIAVRTEACIALGRLGNVAATDKQKKEGESNNLVVRALLGVLKKRSKTPAALELRYSAILGLGISGHPDGCTYLMRSIAGASDTEQAYVFIALGLARHMPAIPMLVENLPRSNKTKPKEAQVAAVHAIGLLGPDAVPELEKAGAVKHIEKRLASKTGNQDSVMTQAVAALGRLQIGFKTVRNAFAAKSKDVQYNAVLAMANYGRVLTKDNKDIKDAATFLTTKAFKAGEGQIKNFSVFAAGELASRLAPDSPTRTKLLKHLRTLLEKNDTYLQGCAAVACGVANDRGATDTLVNLLRESKDTHVLPAVCIGLGLLRHTGSVDTMRNRVMMQSKWEADGRGDAALGIALSGDTTRIGDLELFHDKNASNRRMSRHTPVAIGVLGGKDQVKGLIKMFRRPFDKGEIYPVSSAAFALSFVRDQGQVQEMVALTTNESRQVRGMAVIALGRIGARDRVGPLTRCFENMSHNNRFRWQILYTISRIV